MHESRKDGSHPPEGADDEAGDGEGLDEADGVRRSPPEDARSVDADTIRAEVGEASAGLAVRTRPVHRTHPVANQTRTPARFAHLDTGHDAFWTPRSSSNRS